MTTHVDSILTLTPTTSHPECEAVHFSSGRASIIGRSRDADCPIAHESVSRRHCSIEHRGGRWWISDAGSRHGTAVNERVLRPGQWAPLRDNDSVRIGPLRFTARVIGEQPTLPATVEDWIDDTPEQAEPGRGIRSTIERIEAGGTLAQKRLDLLVRFAATMANARREKEIHELMVVAVREAIGCTHIGIVRSGEDLDGAEIIHSTRDAAHEGPRWRISRSLLRSAAADGAALMTLGPEAAPYGESLVKLNIHSAMCVRIEAGSGPGLFLYADTRGSACQLQGGLIERESAEFCAALARVGGLALADLRRRALESEHLELARDMEAARQVQLLLMPPAAGIIADYRYAYVTRPGRYVAGDLFDCIPLDDGRVAIFLGDVTGKGASAGIVMASAQTYLSAILRQTADPAAAVKGLNRFMWSRVGPSRFVSLWVGVLDPRSASMRFVDAGHGLWLLKRAGDAPTTPACDGGLLVGVDENSTYTNERLTFGRGDRLILLSDGIVEQRNANDEPLNMSGVLSTLSASSRESAGASQDAADIFAALLAHAGAEEITDDATIASIEMMGH